MKWSLLIVLFACTQNVLAIEPNVIDVSGKTQDYIPIANHALILEDPSRQLSFPDVHKANDSIKGLFKAMQEEVPNLDFTTSAYWVKFKLKNTGSVDRSFYLEVARPLTNVVNLYTLSGEDVILENNGDELPFDQRPVANRKMFFDITLPANAQHTYYLKLASDGEVITLPIHLWDKQILHQKDNKEHFLLGGYFGILLFVIIIYFFFYIALKEKSFLYYVIYVASLFMLQLSLDGLAFQFLWPNNPWLGNHAVLISACFTVIFIMKYAASYLKLAENLPKFKKWFTFFILLGIICMVMSLTSGTIYAFAFPIANGVSFISVFLILGAIIAIRNKQKISPFFSLAFVCVILGGILFILGNFNLLPHSAITEHALKIGSAFEVVFLSLTMAGKYRDIQREKENAQAETLAKLEEMNKLKDEINVELEKQVKERTQEINMQKEELQEKNAEIMDSINYAQGIQEAILPQPAFIAQNLPNSFVLFQPKDVVSGDFYWMEQEDEIIYFAAADCTGHGVPGAFVSMVGANGLNRTVNEYNITKPGKILDKLSVLVEETFRERKDGMDLALCALDKKTNVLEFAGANNPLWVISHSAKKRVDDQEIEPVLEHETNGLKLFELKANKQPVGKFEDRKEFNTRKMELEKEDVVYVFSDGYADQFGGPKGKKMKYKPFKKLLFEFQGKSMDVQREILLNHFQEWKGEHEQVDDVCVIGVRV